MDLHAVMFVKVYCYLFWVNDAEFGLAACRLLAVQFLALVGCLS